MGSLLVASAPSRSPSMQRMSLRVSGSASWSRLPYGLGFIGMIEVDVFDESLKLISTLHQPWSRCSCDPVSSLLVNAVPLVPYLVTQLNKDRVRGWIFARHICGLYNIVYLDSKNRILLLRSDVDDLCLSYCRSIGQVIWAFEKKKKGTKEK